jgi:hypothetical protein
MSEQAVQRSLPSLHPYAGDAGAAYYIYKGQRVPGRVTADSPHGLVLFEWHEKGKVHKAWVFGSYIQYVREIEESERRYREAQQ